MTVIHSIKATETAGAVEPVLLADVKTWANIDYADDDALITSMITGAREEIENETNLKLVPNTVVMHAELTRAGFINLPYGDATLITVTDIDSDGTETALVNDTDYYVRTTSVNMFDFGSFKIAYTVGNTVTRSLKEAIMMLVAYRYNNRGDQDKQQGIPVDVLSKIRKHVQIWV